MAKKKTSSKPKAAPKSKAASATATAEPGSVKGHTIKDVRQMTKEELDVEGWETGRHAPPTVLVLDDGTKLYPSQDEEGNGPGALFGIKPNGENFMLCKEEEKEEEEEAEDEG